MCAPPTRLVRPVLYAGLGALAACTNAWAQTAQPVGDVVLPTVQVQETSGTQYYQLDASGATRTGTPLREVPQAVRVLPRQVLDDVEAVRLDDTLDLVSGVSRQNNFGGTWDNIAIRGFSGHENTGMSLLRNGFSSNRGFNAPRDMANVENVEFLKGPSAALYGNSEPGGTVNIVTKKPQFKASHGVEFYAGTHDSYRTALDTTGPIGANLAYRLNVAAEDKAGVRDHVDSERQLVAPALTWVLSERSFLSYDGEYLRQQAPLDRGIVAVNGKLHAVPRENFLGDPNDGDVTQENHTHQITLEHELSEQWRGRLGIAYKRSTLEGTSSEVKPFVDVTGDSVTLRRRYRDYASDDLTVQGELQGQLELGGMRHTVLVGAEAYRFDTDVLMRQLNNAMRIDNIRNTPVYTTLASGSGAVITNRSETQDNTALFVQDEIQLTDRWKLLAGLRYDRFEETIDNHLNGSTVEQTHSAVSPRIGVTYLIDRQWSWYAAAGQSFRPNTGTDANGNAFDPEKGRALETGVKFESADKRLGATLSVFQIDKENVLTGSDPNGVFSIAAGEVRSRGIEFDLSGKLSQNLRVSASYAWLDTEVTKDTGGAVDWWTGQVVNLEGKPLANVPTHSASLFAMWEAPLADGGLWGAGGGVTHIGERSGNYIDTFTLPAYTTVKLSAYWQMVRQLRLTLSVENLFDREYIASSYDRSWLTPGEPRTVTLGAHYKF
ncbi:TonB-dependent siderophore receptor [Denitromonas iodatirespirans]|uniref:TonB-dependent siderophore receptor n=1 Tax=Denitromonas iodatirespirans TaxID=2795389 RepID=A0A944DPH0_DENI1|nr:TonB-dependent siderophore receptor [Denitromonas iodatirespirans]MBT0962284.1 TonB-dependent siderophore receptor [Denitromonas iodatirespirans]